MWVCECTKQYKTKQEAMECCPPIKYIDTALKTNPFVVHEELKEISKDYFQEVKIDAVYAEFVFVYALDDFRTINMAIDFDQLFLNKLSGNTPARAAMGYFLLATQSIENYKIENYLK